MPKLITPQTFEGLFLTYIALKTSPHFFELFNLPIRDKTYILNFEQMKKHKTILTLIVLTTLLISTIRGKTYIEKITNNFLYSDSHTLSSDLKIKH